jgi:hypothetical protein
MRASPSRDHARDQDRGDDGPAGSTKSIFVHFEPHRTALFSSGVTAHLDIHLFRKDAQMTRVFVDLDILFHDNEIGTPAKS